MLAFKESLIGFSQNPWTVIGSCDATSFAMDGTDYWVNAQDDVNWSTGAHSWIVLQQAGISAKFQLCVDLDVANYSDAIIVVSPTAGFGTANGGSDGSTTARPTATDEVVINNGLDWLHATATNYNVAMHVMQSTDGECTRVAWLFNNFVANAAFFDKVKNPHPSWTEASVYSWYDGNFTETATYANYYDSSTRVTAAVSGTNTDFYLASIGTSTDAWGQTMDAPNGLSNEYEVYPIFLASLTTGRRGIHGALFDFWWATETGPSAGDTYDGKKAVQFGYFVWPWDTTSSPIISF